MYDRREIDGAIAELENAEPTMQRVLDAFMDALKRESPEAYKELLHDIKNIRSGVLKCVLIKQKSVKTYVLTLFLQVGVTGFEPTASWSRTKRATNCATPRKEKTAAAALLRCGWG